MKKLMLFETTVALLTSRQSEPVLRKYAEMLAGRRTARIAVIRLPDGMTAPRDHAAGSAGESTNSMICQTARLNRVSLIVAEWLSDPHNLQDVLWLAHQLGVPAVFIRHPRHAPAGRVVVATEGGVNVLQQLWVARETARAACAPIHLLRVLSPLAFAKSTENADNPAAVLNACADRLLDMQVRMEVRNAPSVAQGITAYLEKGDTLVLGAPSALRMSAPFAGSLPDTVAQSVDVPLILLSTPPERRVSFRGMFWGKLIQTGLRPRHKRQALASLINNLALHNQLPRASRADILRRAMQGEAQRPSATEFETAFPHVRLRGFFGLAASLAICPAGVSWGNPDGQPVRFIFLLVTSEGFCNEYLAALAMIARRMMRPAVRRALLECQIPDQALQVLEPDEAHGIWPEPAEVQPVPHGAMACSR